MIYETMITLVDKMLHVKSQIESPDDIVKAHELIVDVFESIKRKGRDRNEK
jgi:hypothetical protein